MVNPVPRTLAGRYEVGELIGRGGMAEVHIGHDNRLGRTVAIKILRSDLARDPSFQARFRREAQAAASLNHPAIVAVYDTGEDTATDPASGQVSHIPFIVMEYVEGHTVRDILRDGNAVPIEEAVEITAGVLSALEYSHHAGIVHRDIKPANVMLTPTGAVKVMDFGIARAVADSAATMTQTHSVIGTAQYLSPEQARGETVDTRSDLYSTGCLLYELLTGRPPFTGDSPVAVAYQHVRELAVPPSKVAPDVPGVLDTITLKALAKDRDERYSSASEFRAALEAASRGEYAEATSVMPVAPANDPFATQVMTPAVAGAAVAGATTTPNTAAFPVGTDPNGALPWQQSQEPGLLDEMEDDDETSGKKRLIWTLVSVGVVALLAIVAILMLNKGDDEPTTFKVPDFTGMTQSEAKAKLTEVGFVGDTEVLNVKNDEVEEGLFIESNPPADTDLAFDGSIELTFSTGPNATTVPDVTDMSQDAAQAAIEAANLKVKFGSQEHSSTVAKNHVIRTEPAANDPIAVGDTVTIFVSDGFIEIEDYTGKQGDEAKAALEKLGLVVKLEPRETDEVNSGDIAEGSVLSQSLPAGVVEVGSTITLTTATEVVYETFPIPDLVGKPADEAIAQLQNELGLIVNRVEENNDSVPAGMVISTFPSSGREAQVGDYIDVKVSLGPTEQPSTDPDDEGSIFEERPGPGNGND